MRSLIRAKIAKKQRAQRRIHFFSLRSLLLCVLRANRNIAVIGLLIFLPLLGGCEFFREMGGDTAAKAAREMNDSEYPDVRRVGMANLVTRWSYTQRPPYTTRYKQLAQFDPDYTVRAMAIRALNISRDASATPIFIAALSDDQELVRLEAVKALGNVPDPAAIKYLLPMLEGHREVMMGGQMGMTDESKDVRIAAADALRQYRTTDVARELIGALDEREFAVAWQARQSLITLTGRDLNYDEAAWLAYLAGTHLSS
jgi:HEAT repeats